MDVQPTKASAATVDADAVIIAHFEEGTLSQAGTELDGATSGALTRLIESQEITGKQGELVTILSPAGVAAGRIVLAGLGPQSQFGRGAAYRAVGSAAKQLAGKDRKRVVFYPTDGWSADVVEAAVCAAVTSCQGQDLYRAERSLHPFGEVWWATADERALQRGQVLGESVNLTRRLVNQPPNAIYPEAFAAEAETVAQLCSLSCEVWDEKRLTTEQCGSLLEVARGSTRPPRLVILEYAGGSTDQPPLALVGKGVTFDSGGLSLKPSDGMKTMKCDMAGAATVLGAMQAIGQLKPKVNVIGLVGLVENMVSGDSYKLGDVLQSRNGKTIEVLNTDAEGRLVLADVLDVAVERGAARIVDLATLTGACVVALGMDVAGLMTNDQPWCDDVLAAARACGEPAWQLPMFSEFAEQIKSKVADIKNIGEGRWGGAITAAKFLEEFVQGKPWVHIDIAGPAFLESEKPWLDAGGSGAFVRTLVELTEQ